MRPISVEMSSLSRPLSTYGRGRRLGPFVVGVVGGLGLLTLQGVTSERVLLARLAAIGLMATVTVAVAMVPWARLPAELESAPAFVVLVVVGLLVSGSGVSSQYAPLVMLPLLWFSVYAGRLALGAAIVVADSVLLSNVLATGDPIEPNAVRAALLWSAVVTVVPWALQRFVHDLQHRAALADRDYVTGLLSRRGWEERLPDEVSRARRDQKPLTIVLLDLDDFKQYNDVYGHQAGDALLRQVAIAWDDALRSTDLLARFGGDEYCAALPGCSAEDAHARVMRLLAITPGEVRASAGAAEWAEGETLESLVRRADRALYEAKANGGQGVVVDDTRDDATPLPDRRAG